MPRLDPIPSRATKPQTHWPTIFGTNTSLVTKRAVAAITLHFTAYCPTLQNKGNTELHQFPHQDCYGSYSACLKARAVKIFINESTPSVHRKAVQTQVLLTFNCFSVSCACLHLQWEKTRAVHSAATIPDHVSSQKTFLSIILVSYCVLSTENATDNASSVLERQSHTVCQRQHSQARVSHQLVQHCI